MFSSYNYIRRIYLMIMIRRAIIFCVLITSCCFFGILPVSAQSSYIREFSRLKAEGSVPEDIIRAMERSGKDYQERRQDMSKNKRAKGEEKFELTASYNLDEMFLGGRVIFGDPVTTYINRVADSLLIGFPEIRRELRFYTTRSPYANAYSTDQGVILVNVGLIARLNNEAELAYILAHEIIHYLHKHNITIFLEKEKVTKRRKSDRSIRNLSLSERLLSLNYRSKEIETFSDQEALRRFYSTTSYDATAIESVFDILLFSEFPFSNRVFTMGHLETAHMVFPLYYYADDIGPREASEEDDQNSTHPSVEQRKTDIRDLIDSLKFSGNQLFKSDTMAFREAVTLARFEVLRQLLVQHQLGEACYIAAVLLDEYPSHPFIRKCFAASLYGLVKYKNLGQAEDVTPYYRNVTGEMKQVSFMITKLSKRDMNILALNYVWRLNRDYPDDVYLREIKDELFYSLFVTNEIKPAFFYSKSMQELKAENDQAILAADTITNKSKRSKVLSKKIDTTFTKFAFVDLFSDSVFTAEFSHWSNISDSIMRAEEERANNYTPFDRPERKPQIPHHQRTYVTRLVMTDPYTVKADARIRNQVSAAESLVNTARVKELLGKNADRVGLELHFADSSAIRHQTTSAFNEWSAINEYIEERFNQLREGVVVSFSAQYIDTIMQRHETPYLGWTAIMSMQKRKPVFKLVVMSLMPYFWPYTIYQFIVPRVQTYYYYVLFNVKTGRICLLKSTRNRSDLSNDHLQSHLYDFMNATRRYYE